MLTHLRYSGIKLLIECSVAYTVRGLTLISDIRILIPETLKLKLEIKIAPLAIKQMRLFEFC